MEAPCTTSAPMHPEKYFFWDDVHPTQAGWEAVMGQLEKDIKDFLHITY